MTDLTRNTPGPVPPVSGLPSLEPPPHPLDSEWFLHVGGHTYGPYTGRQLGEFVKEGRMDGAAQVMLVGSDRWARAAEEPGLASIFRAPTAAPPPIAAAAGSTVVQVTNQIAPPTVVIYDDGLAFGPKSAGVALLLSFLLCGAGQMYCGRVGRGFLMLFGCIVLWFILLGWTIWIWSMFDAYNLAKKMNLRHLQRLQAVQYR
jgi:TM2 domain-containing membrane protein YozV